MNKDKLRKIASVVMGASMTAGAGLGMTGCSNEYEYATKLQERLEFKLGMDFDLCGENADRIDYNYAIIDGEPTIGLTLTAYVTHYGGASEKDTLEARFITDKEFYDKYISADLEDLETLYSLSDEMIINYDPSTVKLNGQIVYQSQSDEMTK